MKTVDIKVTIIECLQELDNANKQTEIEEMKKYIDKTFAMLDVLWDELIKDQERGKEWS